MMAFNFVCLFTIRVAQAHEVLSDVQMGEVMVQLAQR